MTRRSARPSGARAGRSNASRRAVDADAQPAGHGRRAVAARAARRGRRPVDGDIASVDAGPIGPDERHGHRAGRSRDGECKRPELACLDDRVARRERRRLCDRDGSGLRGTRCRAGTNFGQHRDCDDDPEQQRDLDERRAAESSEHADQERAVEPAEPEQRHEERRLDDQRLAVRRRPELMHRRQLGQRAPEPRQAEHDHRDERGRREAPHRRRARGAFVARARQHVDERQEPAEPDGRRGDVSEVDERREHARLVAIERVPRERRPDEQRERARARHEQQQRNGRCERSRSSADERDRDRDLDDECEARAGGRGVDIPLPPRNAASSAKKSRCASGADAVAEHAAREQPEDGRAAAASTPKKNSARSTRLLQLSGDDAPSTEVGDAVPAPTPNASTPCSR